MNAAQPIPRDPDPECLCEFVGTDLTVGVGHVRACPLSEGEPFTVKCLPNRGHPGTIEFAPLDARHPVCPVCGNEVVR